MQRLRESLTLILIGLLPFHAFLVTVGTKIIAGPGHAPLTILAIWKEAVLGFVLLIAVVEVGGRELRMRSRTRVDTIDCLIVALLILAVAVSFLSPIPYSLVPTFFFGFKYDFIPLIAFLVLRRVPWSDAWRESAVATILWVGGMVAAYGIVSFFLPQQFFVHLGYSDLHSLYLPDGPLAAFQQIGSTALRRIQSVMSGPNQLGLWLLLPWTFACHRFLTMKKMQWKIDVVFPILLIGIAIVLTFSRSAWIGAAVIALVLLWQLLPPMLFIRVGGGAMSLGLCAAILLTLVAPNVFVRLASSSDHWSRPVAAMQTMFEHPLGLGLGAAGPANSRVSDACVFLEPGADISWAADRSSLCVFAGDAQMQPVDHVCRCPLLPENWYLQIGIELGLLGFVLFVVLVLFVLRHLFKGHTPIAATFLGISIAALFLHAWEDSAVAYTAWVMIAAAPRNLNRAMT